VDLLEVCPPPYGCRFAAAIVSAASLWISLRKERSLLQVAEVELRASLYVRWLRPWPDWWALVEELWRSAGKYRRAGLQRSWAAVFGGCWVSAWRELTDVVRWYNLLCGRNEPNRDLLARKVAEFIKRQPLPAEMPLEWESNFVSLAGAPFVEAYFMVGHVLIERVYPMADRVVHEPHSPVFKLRVLR
jgi:hypothetical protein